MTLRSLAAVLLVAAVAGCDAGTPRADATAESLAHRVAPAYADTVIHYAGATRADFAFRLDGWKGRGSFEISSLDDDGAPLVRFEQRYDPTVSSRAPGLSVAPYAVYLSWPGVAADEATVRFLDLPNNRVLASVVVSQPASGREETDPLAYVSSTGESFHTTPQGETRIDFPQSGDPVGSGSESERGVVLPSGQAFVGLTDIEVSFETAVPLPSAARFRYPWGATLTFETAVAW